MYRAEPKEPTQFGSVSGSELQNFPFSHSGIFVSVRTKRINLNWFCIWFGDPKCLYRLQPWLQQSYILALNRLKHPKQKLCYISLNWSKYAHGLTDYGNPSNNCSFTQFSSFHPYYFVASQQTGNCVISILVTNSVLCLKCTNMLIIIFHLHMLNCSAPGATRDTKTKAKHFKSIEGQAKFIKYTVKLESWCLQTHQDHIKIDILLDWEIFFASNAVPTWDSCIPLPEHFNRLIPSVNVTSPSSTRCSRLNWMWTNVGGNVD